jgi:integrase
MSTITGTLAHLRPIVIVGIGTGLRPPSEIFNLRRSDVDLERNVLRAGTKTDEEREIPMSEAVREVCSTSTIKTLEANSCLSVGASATASRKLRTVFGGR